VAHREHHQLEIGMNEQQLMRVRIAHSALQMEFNYMQMVNEEARINGANPTYKAEDFRRLKSEMSGLLDSVAEALPAETIAA
jgi:hypothetical protein